MALLGSPQGHMGLWHALEPAAGAEGLAHGRSGGVRATRTLYQGVLQKHGVLEARGGGARCWRLAQDSARARPALSGLFQGRAMHQRLQLRAAAPGGGGWAQGRARARHAHQACRRAVCGLIGDYLPLILPWIGCKHGSL